MSMQERGYFWESDDAEKEGNGCRREGKREKMNGIKS
jgi:hypothetical protein